VFYGDGLMPEDPELILKKAERQLDADAEWTTRDQTEDERPPAKVYVTRLDWLERKLFELRVEHQRLRVGAMRVRRITAEQSLSDPQVTAVRRQAVALRTRFNLAVVCDALEEDVKGARKPGETYRAALMRKQREHYQRSFKPPYQTRPVAALVCVEPKGIAATFVVQHRELGAAREQHAA